MDFMNYRLTCHQLAGQSHEAIRFVSKGKKSTVISAWMAKSSVQGWQAMTRCVT
jgi:hypothetical protein